MKFQNEMTWDSIFVYVLWNEQCIPWIVLKSVYIQAQLSLHNMNKQGNNKVKKKLKIPGLVSGKTPNRELIRLMFALTQQT